MSVAGVLVVVDSEIGARLRRLREARGLTQAEMGERLGMSEAGYRHYESGRARLSADQIPEVADALRMSVQDLLVALKLADPGPFGQPLPEFREYAHAKYPYELDDDLIAMIEGLIERKRQRESDRRRRGDGDTSDREDPSTE